VGEGVESHPLLFAGELDEGCACGVLACAEEWMDLGRSGEAQAIAKAGGTVGRRGCGGWTRDDKWRVTEGSGAKGAGLAR
jgi:hypothetical protein